MNVLICGYGVLGKRHYQSIKKNSKISKIYVYDKLKLENKIINNLNTKNIGKIDIVVIATTAKGRFNLIKRVNSKFNPKFWIIEKFIRSSLFYNFPFIHKYHSICNCLSKAHFMSHNYHSHSTFC